MAGAGELKVVVDASALTGAIAQHVAHLEAMVHQVNASTARPLAACVTGVLAAAAASPRKVTRRALFGLRARRQS